MQKTNINPACFQPFFESASNAGEKGQAQFFTPPAWAEALAFPLPRFRPVIVDLNCGAGNLLKGASRGSTNYLLGCDIDPSPSAAEIRRITANVCLLHPLMRAVNFRADCFVLNPPWDLHWYRNGRQPGTGLELLAKSDLPTVRAAFAAWDGRTPRDTIDSTIATLCLALDSCSKRGEGLLIANEATLQRLIFAKGAPHAALAAHIWAHLIIAGNPMTGIQNCAYQEEDQFHTGIIYFARGHDLGPLPSAICHLPSSLEAVKAACAQLQTNRRDLRLGPEIKSYDHAEDTHEQWQAIAEQWDRLNPSPHASRITNHFNISLLPDGTIKTDLSLFDTKSCRVTKAEAESLFSLGGRRPMQLVMQRQQRAHLERAAFGTGGPGGSPWRVDPKLQEAVRSAVDEYHKVRAPLYPLSPIQRLGYLDECDDIVCCKDLTRPGASRPLFRADHTYSLRSTTIAVKRSGTKLNLMGQPDDVEWDGQELAFYITCDSGQEKVFMEARLRADNIQLSILQPGDKPGSRNQDTSQTCAIDFTLQELVEHFIIPDVIDVARVNPAGYQSNLQLLQQIESLCP